VEPVSGIAIAELVQAVDCSGVHRLCQQSKYDHDIRTTTATKTTPILPRAQV